LNNFRFFKVDCYEIKVESMLSSHQITGESKWCWIDCNQAKVNVLHKMPMQLLFSKQKEVNTQKTFWVD